MMLPPYTQRCGVVLFVMLWCAVVARPNWAQAKPPTPNVVVAPDVAHADKPPKGVDPAIWKRLIALEKKTGEVKDLQANFTQEKHTNLLKKPLVSSGILRVVGSVMRWETLKPQPSIVWMDGQQVKMYYPKDRLVEIYPLGAKGSMPAWPMLRPSRMAKQFRIQAVPKAEKAIVEPATATWSIRLIPRDKKLAKRWSYIDLHLDSKTGLLQGASMLDQDGDRTETRLTKIRINQKLKADALKLKLPKDVKIVRPIPPHAKPIPKR
jgi:outer membrane lipoprotein-sorting protein